MGWKRRRRGSEDGKKSNRRRKKGENREGEGINKRDVRVWRKKNKWRYDKGNEGIKNI